MAVVEPVFQRFVGVSWPAGLTAEGRSDEGSTEWRLFTSPFDARKPSQRLRVMKGATTLTEWDWRDVPTAISTQDARQAASKFKNRLARGPFYLEDGTLVTPAQRPCIAAHPVMALTGPYVMPTQAFAVAGAPYGLWGLASYTAAYDWSVVEGGATPLTDDSGTWVITAKASQFPAFSEAYSVTYVALEQETTVVERMKDEINAISTVLAATRSGTELRMTVTDYAKPAYVFTSVMTDDNEFGGNVATLGSTNTVASSAPTIPWDIGADFPNTDGESLSFFIPEE